MSQPEKRRQGEKRRKQTGKKMNAGKNSKDLLDRTPVLVRKQHFLNASLTYSGMYSCAIDAFLEVWMHKLCPLVIKTMPKSHAMVCNGCVICDLLHVHEAYLSLRQNETQSSFFSLRERIWKLARKECQSFRPMDSNAQISELFTNKFLGELSSDGDVLCSTFISSAYCRCCRRLTTSTVQPLVHYISSSGLRAFDLALTQWPNLIEESNLPCSLRCNNCSSKCAVIQNSCEMSNIIFVEFSPDIINQLQQSCVSSRIQIANDVFYLQAIVGNTGAHFLSAIRHSTNCWEVHEDLKQEVPRYRDLHSLFQNTQGWFFYIYVKNNLSDDFLNSQEQSFITTAEVEENSQQRKYHLKDHHSAVKSTLCQSSSDHNYALKNYLEPKNTSSNLSLGNNHTASSVQKSSPCHPLHFHNYSKSCSTVPSQQNHDHDYMKPPFPQNSNTPDHSAFVPNISVPHRKHSSSRKRKKDSSNSNFSSNKEPKVELEKGLEEMLNFHSDMSMHIKQCTVCHEAWPLKTKTIKKSEALYVCLRCKRDKGFPKKFGHENNMVPSKVPDELQDLTQVEEMLIARAFPVMQCYVRPGLGYFAYKGHTITLPHNVQKVVDILPNLPSDLPIVSFIAQGRDNKFFELRVRRLVVFNALKWLINHNPFYSCVKLDVERVMNLPENGFLDVSSTDFATPYLSADEGPVHDTGEDMTDSVCSSFVPDIPEQAKEVDKLRSAVRETPTMDISSNAYNEYSTPGLATLAFPTLFPDGVADPTVNNTIRDLGLNETEIFSSKLKHLIKFGEKRDGKWCYRFAAHPRFAYWAYNMLFRRRLLGQGNFYLKQHGDYLPDLEELREMAANDSSKFMNVLMHYAKNVTGTNAFWNKEKNNLKAILSQAKNATIFWTLSCAELHWPEFHALFFKDRFDQARSNVIQYPHILDWFFTQRVESFVKHWLYKCLGAEWHWFRYEFSVLRGGVHVHGLARLKNDPGLFKLGTMAVDGYIASKLLESGERVSESLQKCVLDGKEAEEKICQFHDNLITTINPIDPTDFNKCKQHPSKKKFSDALQDIDVDYIELVNTVQRHSKCNSAYCMRKDKFGNQNCRFGYPASLCSATNITFDPVKGPNGEINYRPKIVSERNDSRVNRHHKIQLLGWRGNCDIQLIIDPYACVEYLAKYASKAEKMSAIVNSTFKTVVNMSNCFDSKSAVRKLMIKSVGERDMGIQEVMHCIMSLKFVSSTFNVIFISLDGSKKLNIKDGIIEMQESMVDMYANRKHHGLNLPKMNLITFLQNYKVVKQKLVKRMSKVIIRTGPAFSSNPRGKNYSQFCKFQLIKYEPWENKIPTSWCGGEDNESSTDQSLIIDCWERFLTSDTGHESVPEWETHLENVELYREFEQLVNEPVVHRKSDWMNVASLQGSDVKNDFEDDRISNFINDSRLAFPGEQLASIPFWLDSKKDQLQSSDMPDSYVDVSIESLSKEQKLAFDLVSVHFSSSLIEPLFLIVTGQAGSGKSHFINAVRNILRERCLVTSYYGIAAFSIKGSTLHSSFQLPIRGKRNADLKGLALCHLQSSLSFVKYIIIDEFSVLGQRMLGWLDKRCRQGTGKGNLFFGGISVILVGDTAQLPPISDKVLYHGKPTDDLALQGYCAYKQFTSVVKLVRNERAASSSQAFRELLIRLRNGESTVEDWKLLMSRNPSNFTNEYQEQFMTRLAFENEYVNSYNLKRLQDLGTSRVKIDQCN